MEVASDLLLLELATLNRQEVVEELWDKKFGIEKITLQTYIKNYRKYMPMKCAVLFAYELFSNQSPDATQECYEEVRIKFDTYTQPGEARIALAIMDKQKSTKQ